MSQQQAAKIGLLGNPLADWPNDDLLLHEASRKRIECTAPGLEAALHWPELLAIFRDHDSLANRARAANLRSGLTVVAVSLVGLLIEAVADVLPTTLYPPFIHLFAAVLMVSGFVLGVWHLFAAQSRNEWLLNRFWTERLRQFYFQFALTHILLLARAMADSEAVPALEAARKAALTRLLDDNLADAPYQIERMLDDKAEVSAWIDPAWAESSLLPEGDAAIDTILAVLARQRIAIQMEYTRKKLRPGVHSPQTRATIISGLSDLFTVVVLMLTFATAVVGYVAADQVETKKVLLSLTAESSALIVGLRVLRDGCRFNVDTERYCWYLALTEAIDRRFDVARTAQGKIEALRDLERASYQELRRFISTHRAARFLV